MKKLLLSSALVLSTVGVMMPAQSVMAQDMHTNVATVGSIGKGINWLAKRIHSLDVSSISYAMEKDGVQIREFVAAFSVTGALINNYELMGDRTGLDKVGRTPGMQLFPYTVSITSDGRKFISVGLWSMKNMNKAYGNIAAPDDYYSNGTNYYGDGWNVINRLDALVYEVDESFGMNDTKVERLDLVRTEVKVDILGSSKPGHYLAVVGSGSLGFERHTIKTNNDLYTISDKDSGGDQTKAFNAKYGIGLEYNLPVGDKSNINASVLLNGSRISGQNYSRSESGRINELNAAGQLEVDELNSQNTAQYEQSLSTYQSDKALYEQQNLNGVAISDESYESLTGITLPSAPDMERYDKIEYKAPSSARTYMYISPSVSYSGKLGSKSSFEVNVFGNIPVRDDIKTNGVRLDLAPTNGKQLFGAGIKVKF